MRLSKGTEFMLMALLENIHTETGLNVTKITFADRETDGDMARLKALEFEQLDDTIYHNDAKVQDVHVDFFSYNKKAVNVGHFCSHPQCHTIVQEEEQLCEDCTERYFQQQTREYMANAL